MRLLRLELKGKYKGLENQVFDFTQTNGNIIAFIGLNGSGKSQLLELIAETFAYLERYTRSDFSTRKKLPFSVSMEYKLFLADPARDFGTAHIEYCHINIESSGEFSYLCRSPSNAKVDVPISEIPMPSFIVGYSSGLNQNLQRSFMKNNLQTYDILSIRKRRLKELEKVDDRKDVSKINKKYFNKYKNLYDQPFKKEDEEQIKDEDRDWWNIEKFLNLEEPITSPSRMFYLDYDTTSLIIVSLAILPVDELNDVLGEVSYRIPKLFKIQYDLRKGSPGDSVADIKLLARISGKDPADFEYELMQKPYGELIFDLTNEDIKNELRDAHYEEPRVLFDRLYNLQLLGVANWSGKDRVALRKDDFLGTVKKPLKTELPLSISSLELANEANNHRIEFDDLSDGEAQLMQILAAARIFCRENTLFLFDEPETHLNPSWRTYFHKYLGNALNKNSDKVNENVQVFLSTHSPFMISSLRKEDVFSFNRNEDGSILMEPVSGQTYGTSFDVLIKQHFHLRSLISQTVVSDVKAHLPEDTNNPEQRENALQWIEENMGESMEKAYLLSKLKN